MGGPYFRKGVFTDEKDKQPRKPTKRKKTRMSPNGRIEKKTGRVCAVKGTTNDSASQTDVVRKDGQHKAS